MNKDHGKGQKSERLEKDAVAEPVTPERTRGKEALMLNISAATLVSDMLRTTLGPRGMDKLIVNKGEMTITNDGATILRELQLEHPIATILRNLAETQELEIGDGTTTAVVLAGELLKRANPLIEKFHQTKIIKGYQKAAIRAVAILNEMARPLKEDLLVKTAMTAMTGKGVSGERLARLAVKAMKIVGDRKLVRIIHARGDEESTKLIPGIVIERERIHPRMPLQAEGSVLLIDVPLEVRNTDTDAHITIDAPEKIQGFLDAEESILKRMSDAIIKTGAKIVCSQRGIDEAVAAALAKENILALRRVSRSELELLSRVTGATIISNIEGIEELQKKESAGAEGKEEFAVSERGMRSALGRASAEEQLLGDEPSIFFTSKNTRAVTILLSGATSQKTLETERALEDSLGIIESALRSGKLIPAAGATEAEIAFALRKEAEKIYSEKGHPKEKYPKEKTEKEIAKENIENLQSEIPQIFRAFADAIEVIPKTLSENGGVDPAEAILKLRKEHEKGLRDTGINVLTGNPLNSWDKGILEPLESKVSAVSGAVEVASLILRIDDVIVQDR